jgi:Ca2+-binding EF-hand superfamily protein
MSILSARKFYVIAFCAIASYGLSLPAMAGGGTDCQQKMTRVDSEGGSAGQISASEHAAQASKRFETMDVNKDGSITAAEIDASHGAESAAWAKHRMSSAEKIKQLDGDNDGALTRAEYADGSQKMFRKLDIDSDGTLTAAEMHVESMTAHEFD